MELVQIGVTGRPHGIKGELNLFVDEGYVQDILRSKAVLIGEKPVPYFVERFRHGGKLTVKLETFETREQVLLLSNKPLLLPANQVTELEEEDETPWDAIIGNYIEAEGYPRLGPVEAILDLPEHYLAELTHNNKTVYIPLHEDLVVALREDDKALVMELPGGLLDLGA